MAITKNMLITKQQIPPCNPIIGNSEVKEEEEEHSDWLTYCTALFMDMHRFNTKVSAGVL